MLQDYGPSWHCEDDIAGFPSSMQHIRQATRMSKGPFGSPAGVVLDARSNNAKRLRESFGMVFRSILRSSCLKADRMIRRL